MARTRTRMLMELVVGRSHTVEVIVHIRRKDLNWFATEEESHRRQLFQLLSRKIFPKEFEDEMELYYLEKRKRSAEDGGQAAQTTGDKAVVIGETNKKQKPPAKPGTKRKRGGQKRKQDVVKNNSSSTEERYKFERYVFGETIQVAYRVEDIRFGESALLFYKKSKSDSKEGNEKAEFRQYSKLSKRIILWCYPFDPENPTEPIEGEGFHRPDMIPISSLFRAPAES